jgi:ABC-type lipoprotein export system ATPase subunit
MTPAFVSVDGVEKTYRAPGRTLRALDPTTFALGRGEFVSIVGPSG